MSRGAKVAIGVVALVIALNVALALIHGVTGGTPGGPASSSYSTGADGVAGYAALLARTGHMVRRLRTTPSQGTLDPASTVELLAPDAPVASADADALRRFVAAGGRLLVGGPAGSWLGRVVSDPPGWSPARVRSPEVLAPAAELAGVRHVENNGYGSWTAGGALPLLGTRDLALLSVESVGTGRVLLLASVSPLQNELLDSRDDAALGLALAGPPSRPVTFLEAYHGYGNTTSGFGAVPGRWWLAFALVALAVATAMLAYGRRLGPPQLSDRKLPPPRRLYVDSLGGVLARSRQRDAAVRPVRARAEALIATRARLGSAPSAEQLRNAAIALGVPASDADALTRPALTDADVLALGRVHARITGESPS